MANAWNKWKRVSNAAVRVQAAVLFGLVYLIFMIPLGLLSKKHSNKKQKSYWKTREPIDVTLKYAREQ